MSDFTPEQKLSYYNDKLAYWTRKSERLLAPAKKKHAARRIEHYTAKIEAAKA